MTKRLILLGLAAALGAAAMTLPASAADRSDTIRLGRATVRDAPARLVLANALRHDKVVRLAHCGSWVRIRVRGSRTMATRTGWVLRETLTRSARKGGLDGVPTDCGAARRDDRRWRDFVSAMNGPFSSVRYSGRGTPSRSETGRLWKHVKYPTRIAPLTGPDCVPSYNYSGNTPDPAQRISGLDLSNAGYRYLTHSGGVALVSVGRASGAHGNIWGFVPATCVKPDTAHGYRTVYFPRVVRLSRIPSSGVRTADLHRHGCRGPVRAPRSSFGWWPDPQNPPACPY